MRIKVLLCKEYTILKTKFICLLFVFLLLLLNLNPPLTANQISETNKSITFRVVDPGGKPIQDAFIGTRASWRETKDRQQGMRLSGVYYGSRPSRARATNKMGEGTIEGCHLFGLKPDIDKTLAIVALNEESDWVGLIQIGSEDIGKKVEIPLQMGCRVKGSLTSKGLEKLGQPLSWTNVYVYWEESRFISCSSENQRFEFLLPPGEYRIQAYGTGTEFFEEKIQILPGQKQMELEYDLPVDTIAALKGKKPPEFKDIKGWKNGDAIKLSDLQGKVVLVDFWGYWCSPCLAEMPKLIELHDKYSKEGLVIIGVHDDSLKSMSELDEKLIQIKDKHLVGRNIPFLIALDGGGRKAIKGTSRTTQGATTAAYGIYSFPTTILIDKQGQLFDRFNVDSATDVRKLEVLLGIAEDSHRISTQEFELDPRIYNLKPGEILKNIKPKIAHKQNHPEFEETFYYKSFRWVEGKGIKEERSFSDHITLKNILEPIIGLSKFEYKCSDELLATILDGDWIVRHESTKYEKIQALNRILHNEIKLPISLVHHIKEINVIVAGGDFKFKPLSGTHDDSQIHVYGETLNLEGRGLHSGGNLQQLLDTVAERIAGKPIINLAASSPANDYRYKWLFHRPSSFIDGLGPDEKEKKV